MKLAVNQLKANFIYWKATRVSPDYKHRLAVCAHFERHLLSGIPSSVCKVDMTSQHAFCLATKIQIKVTDREDCILSLNLIFSQRSVT